MGKEYFRLWSLIFFCQGFILQISFTSKSNKLSTLSVAHNILILTYIIAFKWVSCNPINLVTQSVREGLLFKAHTWSPFTNSTKEAKQQKQLFVLLQILQSSNTRKKKKVQVLPYQPDSQHQQNTIISTTKQGTLWTLNPGMWKDELSSLCQKYLDQIPLLLIASGVMLLAAAAKAEIDL